ncbi:MAG: PqqD family protein [Candidatus Eisenbacteria bacterium]|nr:PqqD family protein [Candidatus Eisenbacteria bacterium]
MHRDRIHDAGSRPGPPDKTALPPSTSRREAEPFLVRAPAMRAFENKRGGWTVLSRTGDALEFQGAAALHLWEALEAGARREAVIAGLAARFPAVDPLILRRDALAFLAALQEAGLVLETPGDGAG